MPFSSDEIERLLRLTFGFSPAPGHEQGHRWYPLHIEGFGVMKTKVSHSRKASKNLDAQIAKQLRVRNQFYAQMFRCTRDRAASIKQVQDDPYPPADQRF